MQKKYPFFISVIIPFVLMFACNDEEFNVNPGFKLSISTDTVSFDTVFSTIGTTTKRFTISNQSDAKANVSSIFLAGGDKSAFRLNINGVQTNEKSQVEIEGGDSLFVFVELTVDPTGQNNPMVIHDSIVINMNGNSQDVDLIAFGQDFHLFNGEVIPSQHWENDKPYLIYNSILVDSLETLTIDPGCRIHFHKGSSLFVKGTLEVNGTFEAPVYFQGDRLEEDYKNAPGQWGSYRILENGSIYVYGGIHFSQGSSDNKIDYAIIKNAEKGIQVDSLGISQNPVLTLTNSRVENMTLNCLDARTTYIEASNCIFANSGSSSIALNFGGTYEFIHCTIANYFSEYTRKVPAVLLNNYFEYKSKVYAFDLTATFVNSIIDGSMEEEIFFDSTDEGLFESVFKNCLLKMDENSNLRDDDFVGSLFNLDSKFIHISENNFALDSLSPARNIADVTIARIFPTDINSNSRLEDEGPDLGALEWVQKQK